MRLHIVSMNVDDLRSIATFKTIIQRLQRQPKIDIACIQETHILESFTYEYLDYAIQFSPSIEDKESNEPITKIGKEL